MVNGNHMEHMKLFLNGCGRGSDMGVLSKGLFSFLADSLLFPSVISFLVVGERSLFNLELCYD